MSDTPLARLSRKRYDEIEVAQARYAWSVVCLKDGTQLRLRPELIRARRVRGQSSRRRKPTYEVRCAVIVDSDDGA